MGLGGLAEELMIELAVAEGDNDAAAASFAVSIAETNCFKGKSLLAARDVNLLEVLSTAADTLRLERNSELRSFSAAGIAFEIDSVCPIQQMILFVRYNKFVTVQSVRFCDSVKVCVSASLRFVRT